MEIFEVFLTPSAFNDIESIYIYLSKVKEAPENAKEQTDRIWNAILELNKFPKSHQVRLQGRFAGSCRQLIVDNYLVIYKVDDEKKIVTMLRVLYSKMDI